MYVIFSETLVYENLGPELRGQDTHGFYKEDNFYDFLFAFLLAKSLLIGYILRCKNLVQMGVVFFLLMKTLRRKFAHHDSSLQI